MPEVTACGGAARSYRPTLQATRRCSPVFSKRPAGCGRPVATSVWRSPTRRLHDYRALICRTFSSTTTGLECSPVMACTSSHCGSFLPDREHHLTVRCRLSDDGREQIVALDRRLRRPLSRFCPPVGDPLIGVQTSIRMPSVVPTCPTIFPQGDVLSSRESGGTACQGSWLRGRHTLGNDRQFHAKRHSRGARPPILP